MRGAHLDVGAGDVPLVVEPVEQVAVVLGEPDDLARLAGLELGQRHEALVL